MTEMHVCDLLIVDDDPKITSALERILIDDYSVVTKNDPTIVVSTAARLQPRVILLDIQMPVMSGIDVCKGLKANPLTEHIPVIFITALYNAQILQDAFRVGGADYISKPFLSVEVLMRVENQMLLQAVHIAQKEEIKYLENLSDLVAKSLIQAQMSTIVAISKMMELRDSFTGGHIYRIQHGCRLLAQLLLPTEHFKDQVNLEFINAIYYASALHDIGKLSIPDHILLKDGKLTEEEYELMKSHTTIGADSLKEINDLYPGNHFIRLGVEITKYHHERWDGNGYPFKISQSEIPLSARIMTLIDVYDALRSMRSYKPAWPHEECLDYIRAESGHIFDPLLVDIFLAHESEFDALHHELTDDQPQMIAMY